MDLKSENVHSIKVTQMNCYFSQICQVTSYIPLNKSTLSTNEELNAFVTFKNQELFVITKGGNKFYLPLDQQISKVFPLVQGIMIQFFIKTQSKLQQILFYQRNKDMMDIQQPQTIGKYCYATLTRHPLNPLKILGGIGNNDLFGWHKIKQKITCVSQKLPIILTYNQELRRNAIHILLTNIQQIQQQNKFAYIPSQTYYLKNVGQSSHYQVIVQTIYQSTDSGQQQVNQIKITKGLKKGQLFVYGKTVYNNIRIYSVDLYSIKNSVQLIKIIQNSLGFGTTKLYSLGMIKLRQFQKYHQQLDIKIVSKMFQCIQDCLFIINDNKIKYYYKGKQVFVDQLQSYDMIECIDNQIYSRNKKIKIMTPFINDCFVGLIAHIFQLTLPDQNNYIIFLNQYKNGQPLSQILLQMQNAKLNVLSTLHLLAQQLKLYQLMKVQRYKLGQIILNLATQTKRYQYIDYYLREGFKPIKSIQKIQNYIPKQQVFDLFSLINRLLLGLQMPKTPIYCIYNRSNFILNFIQILVRGQTFLTIQSLNSDISQTKYQFGKQYFYRNKYPLLSQKVYHMNYFNSIYQSQLLRNAKPQNKQQKAFIYLIQNNHDHSDILSYAQSIRAIFYWLLRQMRRNLPFSLYQVIPQLGFNLIHRQDLYKNIKLYNKKQSIIPYHLQKPSFDQHIKTLVHTSTSQQYFLTSNASQMNKINNDLIFQQVDRLLSSVSQIKVKTKDINHIPNHKWQQQSQNILIKFANRKLSVLTGQGAFNFGTSRSFITDIIKIPKININGVMPDDIRISLDLKEDKQSMVYWPQFHSGLASGLKLSRHVIPLSQDHLKTWIFYQKPDSPKRDHSGFLLSLGLLGYLKCFSPTDIYQYLKPNNQFTSIAILLGVSASNISRSDQSLSKTLILHIPVLLPPSVDLQIPINVQTSALIGIGLLHKGTCNRTMTEMTLSQIGKKPSSDKCLDRQGYSLAAGWALGMICLGMNDTKQSFRDLQLQERLIRFIEGGKVMQPPQSMISTNFVNENRCSSIKQGQNVNLHITAPAALLSISFMYLKSNYRELADKISIPNSFNTIQECNPNHVLLKTVAKSLIMWDYIKNTKEYVLDQIPQLIRFIFQNSLRQVHEQYYLIYNVSQIDYQTITTIYASVMTGSIISIALKFAGTGDNKAVQTIKWHIQQLKQIKIIKCQFANDPLNKNCIDQYELFSLLSVSVLALSIVMAGTCDIQCLKIVKMLRKKFQDSKVFHYGFSMALNMAFGFIFLGYGNYTFNRQNMSIAALLISIFPQFPNSPTDNKWHLQALRHFYVLAMQQKIFHAVDVDTNKVVSVNTEMQFIMNEKNIKQNLNTPILLQQSKKLINVKIRDQDYFDIDFSFSKTKIDPKAIYIKRKYFKNINPKMLDRDNVLSTNNIKDNVKQSLQKQIRYKSLFIQRQQKIDLSYVLGKNYNQKLKIENQTKQKQRDLYFNLLKEDNLELIQIYLNLRRQLKQFYKRQSKDNYNIIKNYQLMKSFQKWSGSLQFQKITANIVKEIEKNFIQNPLTNKYLSNPYNMEIVHQYKYDQLGLLNLPSSRNLKNIKKGLHKLKVKNQKLDNIQFIVFSSFPECSFTILNHLISIY